MAQKDKWQDLLQRGTVDVIVRKDLEELLLSGKKLNVKLGIDPTGADLHIGHMVVIRKLREFQDAGHKVFLIFGNFTGQIGDPTDKLESRPERTQEELEKNAKKYLEQASKILDVKKVEVKWNANWLKNMTFSEVVHLSRVFTVAKMLDRDMYQKRIAKNEPIYMHEFLYPLMQGYDSVAIKADVELGGTDQTFNLLAGRDIQIAYGQKPQCVMTVPILEGTDGKEKMGKSTQNYIGVSETPKEIYGKTMSIPDHLILKYFELGTNVSTTEIGNIKKALTKGENPKTIKMRLAKELVSMYHGKKDAEEAQKEFQEIFAKRGTPNDIQVKVIKENKVNIVELLQMTGLVVSKNEGRRMIEGGGVKVDNNKIISQEEKIDVTKERLLQVGKRKFMKIVQKR